MTEIYSVLFTFSLLPGLKPLIYSLLYCLAAFVSATFGIFPSLFLSPGFNHLADPRPLD